MEERKKQDAWRKKSQEGGKRSALSRALRSKQQSTVVEGCLNSGSTVMEPQANSSILILKKKKSTLNGHDPSFQRFWDDYPKKRGKFPAQKAFAKVNPNAALLEVILTKLKEAKQTPEWTKNGGQYIPHPATWLNAKGWEDEYGPTLKNKIPL
jgi:hypothetical protein